MNYRLPLLLACSALVPAPALAQAAPTADDIAALRAQIQALQTEVEQLKATQADQAAQVAKVAATPIPPPPVKEAPGWWGSTTISGKAYFNTSSIHQTTTDLAGNTTDDVLAPAAHGSPNGIETELKRFYVGIDHKFNDTFSANITTDFRYNTNGTSNDVLVYVKKAYLQAKFNPAFTVRVGAADLPWIPFAEGIYGYRFVENTLADRTKFGTSSDWGVHVLGTFGPHNLVSYQVSAIDGNGYKTLARNTNTVDLEGRISVNPIKELTFAVGGYTGKRGKSNDAVNVHHTATRFNALAAYTDKRARIGIEYFSAKNWNNITTAVAPGVPVQTTDDSGHGWSGFGSFAFTKQLAVFGRYDWVKPTRNTIALTDGPIKDHYFNVGVDYKPIGPIDVALVYKHETTDNGLFDTTNGKIGGLGRGKYDELGIFGQLVF